MPRAVFLQDGRQFGIRHALAHVRAAAIHHHEDQRLPGRIQPDRRPRIHARSHRLDRTFPQDNIAPRDGMPHARRQAVDADVVIRPDRQKRQPRRINGIRGAIRDGQPQRADRLSSQIQRIQQRSGVLFGEVVGIDGDLHPLPREEGRGRLRFQLVEGIRIAGRDRESDSRRGEIDRDDVDGIRTRIGAFFAVVGDPAEQRRAVPRLGSGGGQGDQE